MLLGPSPVTQAPPITGPGAPTADLVVLIVVDQMHPDYFTRFHDDMTGGLRRLYDHGTVFLHGLQDHALTQTAPGHATLLSGRTPASTNIISNSKGVPDPRSRIIGAPGAAGASPWNFRGTTLYDWMLARDSGARALSVSMKDRGAILPVGRARANVYWYGYNTNFSTSTWYRDALPAWVQRWNARRGIARLSGARWTLLLPPGRYSEPDTFAFENQGRDTHFPHLLPRDSAALARKVIESPWMDSLTLDLALEGTRQVGLGRHGAPDLLVISLSATDEIGHAWGPDSREMHDQMLRLDHFLGWFMDSLARIVPAQRTIFALSADHAGSSIPQYTREVLHKQAGSYWNTDLLTALRTALERRWHVSFSLGMDYGLVSANTSALRARGVNVDSLSDALARNLRARPEIARVFTPATLATASAGDTIANRWRRQVPPDHEWLAIAVLRPGYIWSSSGMSNHGTPALADVEVPIIFMGPGIRHSLQPRAVRTTSIGPTLARLVGVAPTEPVDGAVIDEVVGNSR